MFPSSKQDTDGGQSGRRGYFFFKREKGQWVKAYSKIRLRDELWTCISTGGLATVSGMSPVIQRYVTFVCEGSYSYGTSF